MMTLSFRFHGRESRTFPMFSWGALDHNMNRFGYLTRGTDGQVQPIRKGNSAAVENPMR
jgi:hypothetical protein